MKKNITVFMFFIILIESYGQTNDTIIKGQRYSFRSYYQLNNLRSSLDSDDKHALLALGNLIGNNKVGHWIYFRQNGEKFAEGSYNNGKKIGKWFFYKANNKDYKALKYSKKNDLIEQIIVDQYGHLEISDITENYNQVIYINGWAKHYPTRFLD